MVVLETSKESENIWLCLDYLSERLEELEKSYHENRKWWNTRLEDMRERFFQLQVEFEDRITKQNDKKRDYSELEQEFKLL